MTQPQPPTNPLSDTTAIIAAYQQQVQATRNAVQRQIEQLWKSLTSWRDKDIAYFAKKAAQIVQGGQRQVASLTEAYLAKYKSAELGTTQRVKGLPSKSVTGKAVRKADPIDVYKRAGIQVWTDLSRGKPLDQAVSAGQKRAVNMALTDLQLAKTNASQQVLSKDGDVVGYRRVLEGAYSCGLCVVASTQRYHKGDLMPIHNFCDCGVAPIYGKSDPGQVINEPLLVAAHDEIRKTFGVSDAGARRPDYRQLIVTHQNGEIGSVLARKSDEFTSLKDIFQKEQSHG